MDKGWKEIVDAAGAAARSTPVRSRDHTMRPAVEVGRSRRRAFHTGATRSGLDS